MLNISITSKQVFISFSGGEVVSVKPIKYVSLLLLLAFYGIRTNN